MNDEHGVLAPLKRLAVFCMLALFAFVRVSAAEFALDLRPARATLHAAAPLAPGTLRATTLAAGATRLPPLAVGDRLAVTLFDDVARTVTLTERLDSPLGGTSFLGTLDGPGTLVNAVVVQSADGLQLDLQDLAHARVYTVATSSAGTRIAEVDPLATPPRTCAAAPAPRLADPSVATNATTASLAAPRLLAAAASTDQPATLVDILVAYDTNAAAWAETNGGGLDTFALTSVAKMNTALANNSLNANFRFRLVGTLALDAAATDVAQVLNAINDDASAWSAVKAKREEVGADIVTVLIDNGVSFGTVGIGWSLQDTDVAARSDLGYNVCMIRAVATGHTMTHEVGHNMGAGHATAVNPDTCTPGPQLYAYSSGYYFTAGETAYGTIMAYEDDGWGNVHQEAPLFSSPQANWEGTAAGDATHDNARTIKNTFAAVSAWRAQKIATSYDVFFSPEGETLFSDSITVSLRSGKSGLEMRYTTDGTPPTLSSPLYTAPLVFTNTTTVKAATVLDGVLGPVYTARYLKSELGTALNAPQFHWTTGADYPWSVQNDYSFDGLAAQSSASFIGDVGCYKTSWIKTTMCGPVELGFRYLMCQWHSAFTLSCDGEVLWRDTSGVFDFDTLPWRQAQVALPAGEHEIKFAFEQGSGYYKNVFNGVVLDTLVFDAWSHPPSLSPETTADEATATTFCGAMTVTLVPPPNRTGALYYTLDGSDPTQKGARAYTGPLTITNSVLVKAVFIESGRAASAPVQGYFLERHPLKPGEWTSDAEGAQAAAARDGRLLAVVGLSRGDKLSDKFLAAAESPAFLAWAALKGVYLVYWDWAVNVDMRAAEALFSDLYGGYSFSLPRALFSLPATPLTLLSQTYLDPGGNETLGDVTYAATPDALMRGFASLLGEGDLLAAPTLAPAGELVDAFPSTLTMTHANPAGTIYYTLDGTAPTPTNGTPYTGPVTIAQSGTTLLAAVWGANGEMSPLAGHTYRAIADRLGTTGIAWTNDTKYPWEYDASSAVLHTPYVSALKYGTELKAVVTGPGTFAFRLKASSNSTANKIVFKRDAKTVYSFAYSRTAGTSAAQTFTYELGANETATFLWRYDVGDTRYSYAENGCFLDQVVWTPPAPAATTTTPVAVPHAWIAAKFPQASADDYEALMGEDSDGDGFANWQEYLCGTDPTDADALPRCTLAWREGKVEVGHNIVIPDDLSSTWRAVLKGATRLDAPWSSADTAQHRFFKVVVEPAL